MADQTPNNSVTGLSLDITQFQQALKEALQSYNVFAKQFTRTLSVRLDPQSLQGISTAFGAQLRQAMGLMKGAQKEAAEESTKTAKTISDNLQKAGFFGKEAFKEVTKAAKKAKEDVKGELSELASASKQAGETMGAALEQGAKKGGEAAKREIAEAGKATAQLTEAQLAQARGNFEKAQKLLGQLQSVAARRAKDKGITGEELAERANIPVKPAELLNTDNTVNLRRYKQALREIREEAGKAEMAMVSMGGSLSRTDPLAESLGARFEKLRASLQGLNAQARARALELFQRGQERMLAEPGGTGYVEGAVTPKDARTPGVVPRITGIDDLYRTFENDEGAPSRLARQRLMAIMEVAVREAQREQKLQEASAREAEKRYKEVQKITAGTEKYMASLGAEYKKEVAAQEKLAWQAAARAAKRTGQHMGDLAADFKKSEAMQYLAAKRVTRGTEANMAGLGADFKARQEQARQVEIAQYKANQARQEQARQVEIAHYKATQAQQEQNRQVEIAHYKANKMLAEAAERHLRKIEQLRGEQLRNEERATIANRLRAKAEEKASTDAIKYVGRRHAATEAGIDRREKDLEKALIATTDGRSVGLEPRLVRTPAESHGAGVLPKAPGVPAITAQQIAVEKAHYQANQMLAREAAKQAREAAAAEKVRAREIAAVNKESMGVLNTHKGIDGFLSSTLLKMGKWVIFFKAVHEITSLIQRSIGGFVDAGVEYTKQLETQQLALRGILAEHAKITTASGEQLHGAAALNALQATAKEQWSQIQSAATSVVGTTADLMGLYTGILPFAAALGADLKTIQDLTKSSAVAARLLDVSFQDARSAMVSLLQGRALTRNRLVGALGFDKEEISRLKESGTLLEGIQSRLDAFQILAEESDDTLAALSESFKDFAGIVASGFTVPFTDLFKEFVKGLTDAKSGFALFDKAQGGFKINPQVREFLEFVSYATKEAIQPIRDFGNEFKDLSQSDIQTYVKAMADAVKLTAQFAVVVTDLTLAVSKFIAENRTLIVWLGKLAAIYAAGNIFYKTIAWSNQAAIAIGFLTKTTQTAAATQAGAAKTISAAGDVAVAAAGKWGKLGSVVTGLARGGAFALLIAGVTALAASFARVSQEAEETGKRIRALSKMDIQGVINNSVDSLQSENVYTRMRAGGDLATAGSQRLAELEGLLRGSNMLRTPTAGDALRAGASSRLSEDTASKRVDALQKQFNDLQKQRLVLERKRDEAFKNNRPDEEVSRLEGELAKLTKTVNDVDAQFREALNAAKTEGKRGELPREYFTQLEAVASQGETVRRQLNAPGGFDPVEMLKRLQRLSPQFSGERFTDAQGKPVAPDRFKQEVLAVFDDIEKRLPDLRTRVEAYERGRQPTVTIEKPEKTPKREDYVSMAGDRVAEAESRAGVEEARLQSELDQKLITEQQYYRQRRILEQELLDFKVRVWDEEELRFKKFLGDRTEEEKQENKQRYENTLRDIDRAKKVAKDEQKIAGYKDAGDEAQRKQRAREVFEEVAAELGKVQADIYGSVEDEAVASFDRTLVTIKKKLDALRIVDKDWAAKGDALLAGMQAYRPGIAEKARNESVIRNTERQLDTARQQEQLLIDQFNVGEVAAGHFLDRLNQLRTAQTALLQQQADAFEAEATRLRQAVLLPAPDGKQRSAENLAAMNAEIATFVLKAEQARQAMIDIHSQARKVQTAIAAWNNLASAVRDFLSISDMEGSGTFVEDMVNGLESALNLIDKIITSANGLFSIFDRISQVIATVKDAYNGLKTQGMGADGSGPGGFMSMARGIGGLFNRGGSNTGVVTGVPAALGAVGQTGITFGGAMAQAGSQAAGAGTKAAGAVAASGAKMALAMTGIGVGIVAAWGIASALFNRAVAKARKDITDSFKKISDGFKSGTIVLGDAIGQAEKERERVIKQYSKSKSGRKALKELLPDIDSTIADMKKQAETVQKNFDDAFKRLKLGNGPFADFARQLMDLEKYVREYLDSFDRTTKGGLEKYKQALSQVNEYVELFFENAKRQFSEEMLGFEAEALGAQERLFGLINERDGLYRQLRDLGEERQDLEEAIAEEQEDRAKRQNKLNDLLEKEMEIRKRIAEIIKQAAEDELAIRRRGVLEAQLSVAQQKAIEISKVRNTAQSEIDRLNKELAGLKEDKEDTTREDSKKDRDFARRRRAIAEREEEVRKAIALNEIRTDGARAVAEIEGEIFGMATDEFDLARKQNDLAIRQAGLQVQKWRETAALVESIVRNAEGVFFEPPPGFPQIRVTLGTIVIDNSDNSTNTFSDSGRSSSSPRSRGNNPETGHYIPRDGSGTGDIQNGTPTAIGTRNRSLGYGDVI